MSSNSDSSHNDKVAAPPASAATACNRIPSANEHLSCDDESDCTNDRTVTQSSSSGVPAPLPNVHIDSSRAPQQVTAIATGGSAADQQLLEENARLRQRVGNLQLDVEVYSVELARAREVDLSTEVVSKFEFEQLQREKETLRQALESAMTDKQELTSKFHETVAHFTAETRDLVQQLERSRQGHKVAIDTANRHEQEKTSLQAIVDMLTADKTALQTKVEKLEVKVEALDAGMEQLMSLPL